MSRGLFITENQLDAWVAGNQMKAHGVIVELVYRLVAASCDRPKIRFPLGDSLGQQGPDGYLETGIDLEPFVPKGVSYWEIGTGNKPIRKATEDYNGLTKGTGKSVRKDSTFIFVTPLSGVKWPFTPKRPGQVKWVSDRKKKKEWKDVRVLDGTQLVEWLKKFPAVEYWLAGEMGLPVLGIKAPEQRWSELRPIGEPPPLIPDVFLVGREAACQGLKEVFSKIKTALRLDTRYPNQAKDFVSAYIAGLGADEKTELGNRCLIISTPEAWDAMVLNRESHCLIADFPLDDDEGPIRIDKALKARHSVIYSGMPGGPIFPNSVGIPNPKSYQLKDALVKAGHKEEHARGIAQKCDGNLATMLRILLGLAMQPEWGQDTAAADLAKMQFLGSWNEKSEADKESVEKMLGKRFGECVEKMREISLKPGTPLTHRDGKWKVVERYECWSSLGPKVLERDLIAFKGMALSVLKERDPQFDLPPDDRYMAGMRGKVLKHSRALRHGIADSLALLGSYPRALTACATGVPDGIAAQIVRELLAEADWRLWASLNEFLPLFAEAAPGQFLDLIESALENNPSLFSEIFNQERTGISGRNYMTGLLWALETLAWSSDNLTRVVLIFGELASMDPGGNWGNRPFNSLTTIFLPWFPQTCAPVTSRVKAIELLMNEQPNVAWNLLLSLLPGEHQASSGSHKPSWREYIPDDWKRGVSGQEYGQQVSSYSELVLKAAVGDLSKLVALIERLDHLPPPVRNSFISFLKSDKVTSMATVDKTRLWNELTKFVVRHKKFPDADWTLKSHDLDEVEATALGLVPSEPFFRHQKLFNDRDFDLYEATGNFQEQAKRLEEQRNKAVLEVFATGGLESVIKFAEAVEASWRVGFALGVIMEPSHDQSLLPTFLESQNKALANFCGGFVWGRTHASGGKWGETVDAAQWTSSQKGQFLAYLPFSPNTWKLVENLLGANESFYWSKANANPYEAGDGLEQAVDELVKHGRPNEALGCLGRLLHENKKLNPKQAVAVLVALLNSTKKPGQMDTYYVQDVIKAVQESPETDSNDLIAIEWAYLPLLDRHHAGAPIHLEEKLAKEPKFFCELIDAIYRPKGTPKSAKKNPALKESNLANAYRLLSEWRRLPGTDNDGKLNEKELNAWLKEVRKSCEKSGRSEVAQIHIGHILAHSLPDEDGFWLNHPVAKVLNAKDAKVIRQGFCTELFNSRGAFVWNGGKDERQLAKTYRERAETVEKHGYHRLAVSLREMAASYDLDAEREEKRDIHEDYQ